MSDQINSRFCQIKKLFNFGRMLSVGVICFEDRFYTSKKDGMGGRGLVSAWGAVHVAAPLAGYRKALVSTGWAISLPFDTKWV